MGRYRRLCALFSSLALRAVLIWAVWCTFGQVKRSAPPGWSGDAYILAPTLRKHHIARIPQAPRAPPTRYKQKRASRAVARTRHMALRLSRQEETQRGLTLPAVCVQEGVVISAFMALSEPDYRQRTQRGVHCDLGSTVSRL